MGDAARWVAALAIGAAVAAAPAAIARPAGSGSVAGVAVRDSLRHADGNRVDLLVTNLGMLGYGGGASPGCFWPIGSGQSPLFAAGLWIGAKIAGAVRVALAEYSSEYAPTPIVPFFPDDLRNHVYKMAPWTGNPADTAHVARTIGGPSPYVDPLLHHGWTEYWEGTWPGGPRKYWRLPNTATPAPGDSIDILGPDMVGDQMLWSVYTDGDPTRHTNHAGGTFPLDVEVQQTTFAYATDALANTVFLRYRIINRSGNTYDSTYVALWSDPDLGQAGDDAIGCDTTRALAYAYNGSASDAVYGTPPPALGFVLLRGPVDPVSGDTLGMTSAIGYIGGDDPQGAIESYRLMRGLRRTGDPFLDPFTSQPSTFENPGDPVRGVGWTDTLPGERKLVLGTGPFRMAPRDTQEVIAAMVIGRGGDNLASVGVLRCAADAARTTYRNRFVADPAAAAACSSTVVTNCPRSSEFWRDEVAFDGALLTSAQLEQVAQAVDSMSTYFDWGPPPKFPAFRNVMDDLGVSDANEARREYAALLANLWAGRRGLLTTQGEEIWANALASVACPGFVARTVGDLAERAELAPMFVGADYLNANPAHRRALAGVDAGLPAFLGGAGPARAFPGSALDPATQPDSFVTVEVRFSPSTTQRAYRWLRLEKQSDGGAPPQGRAYLYGGFRTVPFTVWDVTHDRQLEAGFVERAITDDAGTLLAPQFQPVTFDSTWAPDTSATGGHEWLIVFHRDVNRVAWPGLAVDGLPVSPDAPSLYTLVAQRRAPSDVIDDGDVFRFEWGAPRTPGVDSLLIGLAALDPFDPQVSARYAAIASCLSEINAGIGARCTGTIPAAISVQSVVAERTRVTVTWYTATGIAATIERQRENDSGWSAVATQLAGPGSTVVYEDSDVTPGGRYKYRLAVHPAGGIAGVFGVVSVDVPGESALRFSGARPNPASSTLIIAFSLATHDPARLEVIDVTGRRVLERDIMAPIPGEQTLFFADISRFPSGVYLVRITQGGRHSSGKVALVH